MNSKFVCIAILAVFAVACTTVKKETNESSRKPASEFAVGAPSEQTTPSQQGSAPASPSKTSCMAEFRAYGYSRECVCERQEVKAAWARESSQTLDDFQWQNLRDKKIVFIGDEHGYSDPAAIVNLLTRLRSTAKRQCLLFEMASSKSIKEFTDTTKVTTGDKDVDRLRLYYGKILEGGNSLRFTPYLVDHPYNVGDMQIPDPARDEAIVKNISTLIHENKCDHAIMIVGKSHIAQQYYGAESIITQLAKAKLSVATVNLVFANEAANSVMNLEWNGLCLPSAQFAPILPVVFSNTGIADELLFPSNHGLAGMRYGAFDFTVLFPSSTFKFE